MRLVVLSFVNRNTVHYMNWDFFDTGNTEGITLKLLPHNFPLRLLVQTPVTVTVTLGHSFTVYAFINLWQQFLVWAFLEQTIYLF